MEFNKIINILGSLLIKSNKLQMISNCAKFTRIRLLNAKTFAQQRDATFTLIIQLMSKFQLFSQNHAL